MGDVLSGGNDPEVLVAADDARISSPSGSTIIVVYRRRVWRVIKLRADADTSRMPVVWAPTETDIDGAPMNAKATMRPTT